MVMRNKKGFMRVLEATIAVMIILGALIVIGTNRSVEQRSDLSEVLPSFLEEAASENRRDIVLIYDTNREPYEQNNGVILNRIEGSIKEGLKNEDIEIKARICDLDSLCPLEPYALIDGEVFVVERVVSASLDLNEFGPRKLKVFAWRKNSS